MRIDLMLIGELSLIVAIGCLLRIAHYRPRPKGSETFTELMKEIDEVKNENDLLNAENKVSRFNAYREKHFKNAGITSEKLLDR
ncbi:MAG TPA: hypothetical protein VK625_11135, partial [Flavitalea sp.]|nr:hypothetical protein [Flavitalea sp.]